MSLLGVACASRSETGERKRNEDRALVRVDGTRLLALVADGAGGHIGGAEASRRASLQVESALSEGSVSFSRAALETAVQSAHRAVQEGTGQGEGGSMHTTLVVLWLDVDAGTFLWASVGDSRIYRVRDGVADLLSTDDSVVQRLVDAKMLTPEQAATHPQRNQLVAALGIDDALEPHGPQEPERLVAGDAFLLCSDGWWGVVDPASMAAGLDAAATPEDWLDAMQTEIDARRDPKQDNFSAVAIVLTDAGDTTRPMSSL